MRRLILMLAAALSQLMNTTDAEEVTAHIVVDRCLRYVQVVEHWLEREEFTYLTDEHTPLLLSLMAQESHCSPNAVSRDGYNSVGLMQVRPTPWRPPAEELIGVYTNVRYGMYILDTAIEIAGGDLRYSLAFYNCSYDGVMQDRCGPKGGLNYADRILGFWLPRVLEVMDDSAAGH